MKREETRGSRAGWGQGERRLLLLSMHISLITQSKIPPTCSDRTVFSKVRKGREIRKEAWKAVFGSHLACSLPLLSTWAVEPPATALALPEEPSVALGQLPLVPGVGGTPGLLWVSRVSLASCLTGSRRARF